MTSSVGISLERINRWLQGVGREVVYHVRSRGMYCNEHHLPRDEFEAATLGSFRFSNESGWVPEADVVAVTHPPLPDHAEPIEGCDWEFWGGPGRKFLEAPTNCLYLSSGLSVDQEQHRGPVSLTGGCWFRLVVDGPVACPEAFEPGGPWKRPKEGTSHIALVGAFQFPSGKVSTERGVGDVYRSVKRDRAACGGSTIIMEDLGQPKPKRLTLAEAAAVVFGGVWTPIGDTATYEGYVAGEHTLALVLNDGGCWTFRLYTCRAGRAIESLGVNVESSKKEDYALHLLLSMARVDLIDIPSTCPGLSALDGYEVDDPWAKSK